MSDRLPHSQPHAHDQAWENLYRPQGVDLPPPPLPPLRRRLRQLRRALLLLVLISLPALAITGLFLRHSARQLFAAIEQHDAIALARQLDWDRVQSALQRDLLQVADSANTDGAGSSRYLDNLIDITVSANAHPDQFVDVLAGRAKQFANYASVHPQLDDVLDSVQIIGRTRLRLDLQADPYTVYSGLSLCLRPSLTHAIGWHLFAVGWPELERRCGELAATAP